MAQAPVQDEPPTPKGDRLASGSVFTFGSFVAARAATVINSIVMVRVLGPNDYGVLSIIVLLFSFAAMFASFQIQTALVKFLATVPPNRPEESSGLIGAGFVMTAISTAVTAAVLIALAPALALGVYQDARLEWMIPVASVGMVIAAVTTPFWSIFQGFERIREMSIRSTIVSILTVPSTVALILLFGLSGAIVSIVVNNALFIVVNLTLLRSIWLTRRLHLRFPRDRATYRRILNYALPAFCSGIVVTFAFLFANSLLQRDWTFVEVGEYSAGYGLATYLQFISSAIGVPLVPIVSKLHSDDPDSLPDFIMRTFRVTAFITLIPALFLTAMPEPFLRILYGSSYVGASNLVRLVAPAMFLVSLGAIAGFGMAGTGQMWGALLLNGFWAVPFLLLSVLMIPPWGQVGLGYAIIISYIVLAVVAFAFAKYVWHARLGSMTEMLVIAAVSFSTAAFISLYTVSMPRFLFTVLLILAVFAAGYRAMSEREREVLTGPLKKSLDKFRKTG